MPKPLWVAAWGEDDMRAVEPVFQEMPGVRVRVNPDARGALVCWCLTVRERYDRQARLTLRGLKGVKRERQKGLRRWGKQMCRAIDALILTFGETLDARLLRQHCDGWDSANAALPEGGA